jgi:hypothetical protein
VAMTEYVTTPSPIHFKCLPMVSELLWIGATPPAHDSYRGRRGNVHGSFSDRGGKNLSLEGLLDPTGFSYRFEMGANGI